MTSLLFPTIIIEESEAITFGKDPSLQPIELVSLQGTRWPPVQKHQQPKKKKVHEWMKRRTHLYVDGICEQHAESIDTHSPSSSWWKSIFQRGAEDLIDDLSFIISFLLVLGLHCESFSLDKRVVEFSVSIAHFASVDEQFKSFCLSRKRSMTARSRRRRNVRRWWDKDEEDVLFGKRTHDLWMVTDESWIDALWFYEFSNQLIEKSCSGLRFRTNHILLFTHFHQMLSRL